MFSIEANKQLTIFLILWYLKLKIWNLRTNISFSSFGFVKLLDLKKELKMENKKQE